MAAIFAAGQGRRVLLLERTRDGGRKILVSGGGRCNVLPSRLDPGRFVTDSSPQYPAEDPAVLAFLDEQRRFFEEEAGIELALEPETGKLFPASNSARQVRDAPCRPGPAQGSGGSLRFAGGRPPILLVRRAAG